MLGQVFKANVTDGINLEILIALSDASRTLNYSSIVVLRYDNDNIVFGVFHTKNQTTVDTYLCEKDSMFYKRFYKQTGQSDKEYYFIVSTQMISAIKEYCQPVKLSLNDELNLFPRSYK